MAAKQRYELWVGILLAVAMALLAWMAIKVGAVGGLGEQVHAQIRIHDAAGIAPGASVLVYGVEVGRVERMELGDGAAIATVSLQAQAHLQRNALVLIRARSVLGEKYLEMKPQPGEAALIAEGDELAISEDQIEIDEIVNQSGRVLQAVDAEAMAAAFREMSQELAKDPGRLNAAFKNLEVLLQRGAEVAEKLPAVVDHADATLARLDALLDEGSATARDARAAMQRFDEVVNDAQPAIRRLPATMDRLDARLDEAQRLVADYDALAVDARRWIAELDGVQVDLKKLLHNFSDIDKWELRRLLREEGILIRVRPNEVIPAPERAQDAIPK